MSSSCEDCSKVYATMYNPLFKRSIIFADSYAKEYHYKTEEWFISFCSYLLTYYKNPDFLGKNGYGNIKCEKCFDKDLVEITTIE